MARIAVNGAIVSDDGQWYRGDLKWRPLMATPTTGAPKLGSAETREAAKMMQRNPTAGKAGKALAEQVGIYGSVEAAERTMADFPGVGQAVSTPIPPAGPAQVVKTYKDGKEFAKDSKKMIRDGWLVVSQSAMGGHVNVRRTAARVATGGFLLGGASRSKDQIMVTYQRSQQ